MDTQTTTQTQALIVPDRHQDIVPQAVMGHACDETTPTIQGAGADTIYFSFDVMVSDAIWERLRQEQEVARELDKTRRAVHCPDWLNARLSPTGAKGGYTFLIETPTFSIKLLKNTPRRPPIYVEMRAFGLHTYPGGELAACEAACTYIREVLLADQDQTQMAQLVTLDTARCSRLDLYLDWQGGWQPSFESGDERSFIKRVHADAGRKSTDGKVTGYTIGKSEVQARIYNKTIQMQKAHIEWYSELLTQRNGATYDAEQPLWRLEFQLQRAGVKGFRLVAKPEWDDPDEVIAAELDAEDLPHIHSVRKALHWADRLWIYLTKHWLRLVIPTSDPNRGRWPEHPTWTALREGYVSFVHASKAGAQSLPEQKLELVRAKRHAGYRRLLDRMGVGLLEALEANDTDPGAALVSWLAYLHRIARLIREQQERRADAWDAKRAGKPGYGHQTSYKPDLAAGMGARLDSINRLRKREAILEMTLGVFTSAGIAHLQLPDPGAISAVSDLLVCSLDELEAIAKEKGGVEALLAEKWQKLYKATCPRRVFSQEEMRQARAA